MAAAVRALRRAAPAGLALALLAAPAAAAPHAPAPGGPAGSAAAPARKAAQRLRLAVAGRAGAPAREAAWWPARAAAAAAGALVRPARLAGAPADSSLPPRPNVRCNDPAGEPAGEAQCDPALARCGQDVVAAWLDGAGDHDGTLQDVGWAVSTDGAATWTDRGTLPLPAGWPQWHWTGSPALAVDPATGTFTLVALADASPTEVAIGALAGRFAGGTIAWGAPVLACGGDAALEAFARPAVAVDLADGRVQLVYVHATAGLGEIDAQWADSALATWSAPQALSTPAELGLVQAPRVLVDAGGAATAAWFELGPVDADYFRVCRSGDRGVTWATPNDAVSLYTNWGSGAPGDNAAFGPAYPALAVDRSGGPHAGRLLLAWNESLDWYADAPGLGAGGTLVEVEPNDTPATATPLVLGQVITGSLGSTADQDWYAVALDSAQSLLAAADTVADGEIVALRLFAPDGVTRLAFTTAASADLVPGYQPPYLLFTAPAAGRYFLRVAAVTGAGVYRVRTGPAGRGAERGRDQRDVFSAYSDDGGATWSEPVRVSASPVGFDDWLPEVAIADDGHAYCAWYDWRQAPASTCGGESALWLARSDDGGASWIELGATSDARTAWSAVASDLAPNQGTRVALVADASAVTLAWTDGRRGDPDIESSWWTLGETPVRLALVAADARDGRVHLRWFVDGAPGLAATLWRSAGGGPWHALAPVHADGTGAIDYTDADVEPGATYAYRLALPGAGGDRFEGEATVTVPALALALAGPAPNPVRAGARVTFALPAAAPATLALVDVAGRVVWTRDVGGLGPGAHALALPAAALPPGLYVLTLAQQGRRASARLVVAR